MWAYFWDYGTYVAQEGYKICQLKTSCGIGGERYLRLGGAHAPRGVWGHAPPEKFLKLGAVRSLLRPYLYSNLYLDSMLLEYWARVLLECHVQGLLSHQCTCSSDGKKVTVPDSLKGRH